MSVSAGRIVIHLGTIVIFWLLEYSCFTMILWCWRRLLRAPWTARGTKQSIFKEINLKYSWKDNAKAEAAILWPLEQPTHWKRLWCWERLRAGGEGDDRGWDGWMAPPTQWTWTWANTRRWWGIGCPACCSAWGHSESDLTSWLKSSKLRSNAALCSGTVSQWQSVFGTKAWGICPLCLWFLLHACHFQRTEFWSSSDLF